MQCSQSFLCRLHCSLPPSVTVLSLLTYLFDHWLVVSHAKRYVALFNGLQYFVLCIFLCMVLLLSISVFIVSGIVRLRLCGSRFVMLAFWVCGDSMNHLVVHYSLCVLVSYVCCSMFCCCFYWYCQSNLLIVLSSFSIEDCMSLWCCLLL